MATRSQKRSPTKHLSLKKQQQKIGSMLEDKKMGLVTGFVEGF